MDIKVNLLAVLLGTVVSMMIGMIWYHPKVFGTAWMKMANVKMGEGNMVWTMGTALLSSFLMAYVLAYLTGLAHRVSMLSESGNSFTKDALLTGLWVWVGFLSVRAVMRGEFNLRRKKETLIHIANDLVTIVAMALIIGAMGVK